MAASRRRVDQVLTVVANRTDVSVEQIKSTSRVASVVAARRLAAHALRHAVGLSLPEIGVALKKDHTSVLAQVRAVDAALAAGDERVKEDVAAVTADVAAIVNGEKKSGEKSTESSGRRKLEDTRDTVTRKFTLTGEDGEKVDFYFHLGLYPDGSPGEIFIKASKQGDFASGALDLLGVFASLALQYGCPFEKLVEKSRRTNFLPSGFTGDPEFPRASSFMDAFAQWAEARVLPPAGSARGAETDTSTAVQETGVVLGASVSSLCLHHDGARCPFCAEISPEASSAK